LFGKFVDQTFIVVQRLRARASGKEPLLQSV